MLVTVLERETVSLNYIILLFIRDPILLYPSRRLQTLLSSRVCSRQSVILCKTELSIIYQVIVMTCFSDTKYARCQLRSNKQTSL